MRAIVAHPAVVEPAVAILRDELRALSAVAESAVAAVLLELLVGALECLDRPVETVTAMEQLVALSPDNVDYLYAFGVRCVEVGAWAKAAQALERVGALAERDKACLALRAAAKLYCDNGQYHRAVDVYRAICAQRPGDRDAWRALEQLLEQLERWAELAEVKGELAKRTANVIEKAALLRAQARALAQAGDGAAAAGAAATAARCTPEDVGAILDHADTLVRIGKPREAADVIGKLVAAAIGRGATGEELADLRGRYAAILEDGCGDRAAAAAVLDELLADSPSYVPALERKVWHASHDPDPRVHAAALVQYAGAFADPATMAGTYCDAARRYAEARDYANAVRCVQAALEVQPYLADARALDEQMRTAMGMEAALAELDQLIAANNLEAAQAQLRALLAARSELPATHVAQLVFRHAQVIAGLGDLDAAHRLLDEAHHLDRHSLLITLALGQSCCARKLWRQATVYFARVAEHPDALRYASRVAHGLVQAAQAEVRALRPANALKHYESAVQLDPSCAPAWHQLAIHAVERGDVAHAAECFEREAAATPNASERAQRWIALGDFAAQTLDDRARAALYWARGADGNVAALDKLLAVQRERGADRERAESCMRIAQLDPDRQQAMLQEAAEAFVAAGNFVGARAAADRLMELYPLDVDAVRCASHVALAACDADAAAAWLQRALATSQRPRTVDPIQAELWLRLGDTERSRHRGREARAAYERAITCAPESSSGLAARRALMQLTPKSGRSLESLELLVEAEQSPNEIIALARAFVAAERVEDARVMFDLARALDVPLTAADDEFLARTTPPPFAYDEDYGSALDESVRKHFVDDVADGPLAAVLDVLGEALALIVASPVDALRTANLGDPKRIPISSHAAVAGMYPQIAKALLGPPTLLYSTTELRHEVCVLPASPPAIVIGHEIANVQGIHMPLADDTIMRFTFGRVVELTRPRRLLAANAAAFEALVHALWGAFGLDGGTGTDAASIDAAKRLQSKLPIGLRHRIIDLLERMPRESLDLSGYTAACNRAADRSGLLACGDASVAIELAGGRDAAPHLIRSAASREYRFARQALRAHARGAQRRASRSAAR